MHQLQAGLSHDKFDFWKEEKPHGVPFFRFIDQLGLKSPEESLRYLRRTRQLGFVKVCGKILIPRQEIVDYLQRQTVPAMD